MKKAILEKLREKSGSFVSGEELSRTAGVTRSAIWKHIKQLKEEGYDIESISRRGYQLKGEPDTLDAKALEIEIKAKKLIKKIIHFDSIDSTNTQAKILAAQGEVEGTVVIAEEQTEGRGRLGRQWLSPKGTGIWMSMILRPEIEPWEAAKITQVAAAAVAIAIRESTGCQAGIKWPNDIIINGKKVCGILTEMSGELNSVNFVVLGIGMNVNVDKEEFPLELQSIAASIKEFAAETASRKEIVVKILSTFEELYEDFVKNKNIARSIDVCRKYSVTLGRQVRIIQRGSAILGEAMDINDEGELIITNDKGEIQKVVSGEVSVRGITDYI